MVRWLKDKLNHLTELRGVDLDENTDNNMTTIITEAETTVKKAYPEGPFQQVFWDQAANRPGRGRRWHPLTCFYGINVKSSYPVLTDGDIIESEVDRL